MRNLKRVALAAAVVASLAAASTGTASAAIPGVQGCVSVGNLNTAPPPVNWTDGRHSPKEQAAFVIVNTAGNWPQGYYGGVVYWRLLSQAYNPSTGSLYAVPLSEDCVSQYAHRRSDGVIYKTTIRTRIRVTSVYGDVSYGDTRYRRVCAYPATTAIDSNGLPVGSNCLTLTQYNIG